MLLLNSIYFGKYAFMPIGWLFMAYVVLIEIVMMSRFLSRSKNRSFFNSRVAIATFISNLVSAIIGVCTSIAINGGRLLTVWFPWVSSREVDVTKEEQLFSFVLYIAVAFVATVIIEMIVNYLFLNSRYKFRQVMRATIIANMMSYLLACFALYYYSFFLFE